MPAPTECLAELPAEGITVGADSTLLTSLRRPGDVYALWGEPVYAARKDTILNTSAIARLSITSRPRGALEGGLLGLVLGVSAGALLGLTIDESVSKFDRASFGGFFGAIFGTGIGLAFGAGTGSTHVFEFDHQ